MNPEETSQEKTDRESQDTRDESKAVRKESASLRYFLVIHILTFIVFAVLGTLYITWVDQKRERAERAARIELEHAERKRDQQFCGVFSRIDKQYQATPPPTEAGKIFAADVRALVESLDCP